MFDTRTTLFFFACLKDPTNKKIGSDSGVALTAAAPGGSATLVYLPLSFEGCTKFYSIKSTGSGSVKLSTGIRIQIKTKTLPKTKQCYAANQVLYQFAFFINLNIFWNLKKIYSEWSQEFHKKKHLMKMERQKLCPPLQERTLCKCKRNNRSCGQCPPGPPLRLNNPLTSI